MILHATDVVLTSFSSHKYLKNLIGLTLSDAAKRTDPMGINTTPIRKNKGNAVLAVRIGCHAFNLCCLKLVSEIKQQ